MNDKVKYLIKNTGILTVSNFASKILGFFMVPLYTGILSTKEMGIYDLIISSIGLLVPILTLNITDAVMRFSMDKTLSVNKVASIGLKYNTVSCSLALLFLIAIRVLNIFPEMAHYEIAAYLCFVLSVFNQFLIQFAKGLERIKDMAIVGVLGTIITISSNIICLVFLRWGLTGFFVATILSQSTSILYLALRLHLWKYITHYAIDKDLQKSMLTYCVPLIVTAVGWWVNSASDKYVVAFFCGVAANGIFSVSYKIPSIMNMLQGIFMQAWQISAIKEYGNEGTKEFYGKAFVFINGMLCMACSLLIIMTRIIAHFLFAKDFYAAWQYVPFLLISSVINSAAGFLGPILSAKKDSGTMARSAIIGAGSNLVLNVALVYLIGMQGAAIATVAASFIIYFVRYRATRDDVKIHAKIIYIMWLILCFQSCVEIYFSNYLVEIVLLLIVCVLNRNVISNVLSTTRSLLRPSRI